LTKKGL